MRGYVVKPFPWSPDGIRVEGVTEGEEREFGRFFTGLRDFGFVREVQAVAGAPETGAAAGASENKTAEGGSEPGAADAPPDANPAEQPGEPSAPAGAPETRGPQNQAGPPPSNPSTDADQAPPAPPQPPVATPDALEVKHVGRGKYAVYRGDERLTDEPLTKEEAEAELARLGG